MTSLQTDNSFFADKVMLRVRHLPDKDTVNVLDAYAGDGLIWQKVGELTDKKIQVVGIDKKRKAKGAHLFGDNVKYLAAMNLATFDVIDLDAYGVPYHQLEQLFRRGYGGVVFVTFIQSQYGRLPTKMLGQLGYPRRWVDTTQSLFNRHGWKKFRAYLALRGVESIHYKATTKSGVNCYYLCFSLDKNP